MREVARFTLTAVGLCRQAVQSEAHLGLGQTTSTRTGATGLKRNRQLLEMICKPES